MPTYLTKSLLRKCPLCDNSQGKVLHTQTFELAENNFLPSSYDVTCCNKCGFVFSDTTATQADYDKYYQDLSKYESPATSSGGGMTTYDQSRLEETAKTIARFFPSKDSNILDVGCANGGLLLEMQKLGYGNLSGLDPSPTCVAAVNKMGIRGSLGGLYTQNNFLQKFDGILLTHVLEHVCDVRGAVEHMMGWLKDGGKLYIEVPDAGRYRDFLITPYYFFDVEHINHFDEVSLRNLFSGYDGGILAVGQKDMPVSKTNNYPAIFIVFQKFSEKKVSPILALSVNARESILDHVKQSKLSSVRPELEMLVMEQTPVVVWGAGQATQRLLQNTSLRRSNILFFVDNDEKKHSSMIRNKKILDPKEIKKTNATIIICSALHSKEILKQINEMGLNNPNIVLT